MDRSTEPQALGAPRAWPLSRDQAAVLACLGALVALAVAYMFRFSQSMRAGPSSGGAAAMADIAGMAGMAPAGAPQTAASYALLAVMWIVMMAGMMLPSAAPMILLFAAVKRKSGRSALRQTMIFVGGYLLVWTAFALVAAGLQQVLADRAIVTPSMAVASRALAGGVLILAGLYELSPLKQACLRHCRGPASFIAGHWRPGPLGALRMGARHGLYCLGCCWALMLLLFVGGVMSFAWIAGLAVLILVQKLAPGGGRGQLVVSAVPGVAAIVAGVGSFAG